jgi:hypothetical protein
VNEVCQLLESHDTPLPQQLHTICFVFADIHGHISMTFSGNLHSIRDQIPPLIHIEVQALEHVLAQPLPPIEFLTPLHALTIVGSAVEPVLRNLTLSAPKKVQELRLSDSNANGTTLREYLAAIEKDGGGTSGMQVVWNNCPNFSGEYGAAFGELHL